MVRTQRHNLSSIPGWGTEIPQAAQLTQEKKEKKKINTQKPTDNCSWLELQLSRDDMGGALGSRQIVFHSWSVGIPGVEEATKVL